MLPGYPAGERRLLPPLMVASLRVHQCADASRGGRPAQKLVGADDLATGDGPQRLPDS